jgi:hypothetical protein
LALASQPLRQRVEADMQGAGINTGSLPDDMDQRYELIDERLSKSTAYAFQKLFGEWHSRRPG